MASTDARPVPIKAVAFRVVFPILDADGDLVTGATGLDSEVSKDQGTFADCTNEATEIATASGMYYLDLTSTEMDADCVSVIVKTTSSGAKTTCLIFYPEEAGDINVDVTAFGGTAGTFSAGRAEVNTSHAAGTAWNSGSIGASTLASDTITAAKIAADAITDAKVASDVTIASVTGAVGSVTGAVGSVTGNVGGNVTGSIGSVATGGITAASLASDTITAAKIAADAITAAKIADGAIDAATFAAGAINAAAIAADAITDAKVASDVTIASVTGAVGSVTGSVGSVTGAVGSVTGNVGGNVVGSVASVTATVNADVVSISGDATAADNLEQAFDDTAGAARWTNIVDQGTAQSATGTTLVLRAAAAFADSELVGARILITGGSAGVGQSRLITGYVSATDTATVSSWTTTPTGTITYKIFSDTAAAGGSAPTAAEVADAVWDEATAGHTTSGTFGEQVKTDIDDILVDTAEIGVAGAGLTNIDLPNQTMNITGNITGNLSGSVGSVTGAVGSVTGSVGSVATGGISAASLASDTITAAKIAADAITAAKIADGAIDAATFAAGAINAAAIAADAITDAKVASDVTIASVTGAVGSVTGAVGSVTGNVGGNVTGSVGSVATGGIAAASFAAGAIDATAIATNAIGSDELAASAITEIQSGLSTLDAAGVRTAVGLASANLDTQLAAIDDFLDTEIAAIKAVTDQFAAAQTEPSAVPAANATPLAKIAFLAALARNKVTQTATTQALRNDADSGNIATAAVSDDGTTFTRAEWA